ncbi:putative transcription factor B3-Domain family [Helianthus annuus]|uniref:Transcription factor B3-Domain family n=1 Tax=Helianthus annuus TaxID=4232 RepID=A0A9K3DPI6_HELAN|nr:B3 domain-containing protein At5g42700 isoform X2 [Helianthus annuus]KAF5759225.1 putative transcription factor B3-Domain family [Helianthus annuus]KAJ0437461.1 putative transcription factor B3-Domain family [Helianthus annuus]KAJ0459779.1 putative transcription factor B3-Domain family [Helianthus annuus]KAJ0640256.1 putative transcription factor B3-Domain family [Helianthus annuus]KAJ0644206.1 putative transcription factor B3-Domain family [Helianthus annuus]
MDSNKQTTSVEQDSEMKQNLPSDKMKKRKRTSKEPKEAKSKDKQIMADKPKKHSGKGKRTKMCDIYNDAEDQYMCLERAAFFLETLDKELPKFAKCMLPSNVLYSFWLILPKKFCLMHLPDNDATIILVDESGKEFKTNYLKIRHGLSAGWRGFSVAQRLLQGDILFFHLVEPCKLQVNIVRRYGQEAIEAAVCLMEMHPRVRKARTSHYFEKAGEAKKEKLKCKEEPNEDEGELKNQDPLILLTKKGKRTRRSPKKFITKLSLDFCTTQGTVAEDNETERVSSAEHCENSSDGLCSEVVQGSTSEMTNQSQPDEIRCYDLNLSYHDGNINCLSTAERIFHSPTVET